MRLLNKTLLFIVVFAFAGLLDSCSGARVSAGVGLNVHVGPHGAHVSPSLNVGVYNGGRW